jgi:hypothetical protein
MAGFLHQLWRGKTMLNRGKQTLVESVLVLALMGIVAGAAGGVAIGLVTGPKATPVSSTAK